MNWKCTLALVAIALASGASATPKRWNGPANLNDTGTGVAVDGAGNTFTVGTTDTGGANGKDVVVVARQPNGSVLWTRQFDLGLGLDEIGKKIVYDTFGNVFVLAQFDDPGTGTNILVVKYTIGGAYMGRLVYNGPFNLDDVPTDIKYDTTNFVVVTGSSMTPAGTTDAVIVRMMDNMSGFAFRLFNGPANGDDVFNAVAVDPLGNMYVTGTTWAGFRRNDLVFVKFAPNFILLAQRFFNGIVGRDDYGIDITVDNAGWVMIAGTTNNGPVNNDDILVLKFFWTGGGYIQRFYDRGAGSNDRAVAIASAPGSSPVVVGTSEAGNTDVCLLKFPPALGAPQWALNYNGPANRDDVPTSLALDAAQIYVSGRSGSAAGDFDSSTLAVSLAGAPLWANTYDFAGLFDSGSQVVASPAGVFVSGTSNGAAGSDQTTDRLNPATGASMW
ncbi:MAG: SBBP repeat-containing protein [Armatimonadetes bacterium]|nr:SBBP repeat-containing protein [Armatimonadota bacterium]